MGGAAFVARLLLAAVFLVAGAGKLLDLPGSRRAVRGFGVAEPLANFGGVALPLAELATAAALLIEPAARWGAVAALVLLAAFTVGIVSALARGETPDCHCFGQLHSAPAGRSQLVRNAVLAAVAAFVVAAGPGSASDIGIATSGSSDAVLPLAALSLLLLVISLHLWRERRGLREHLTAVHTVADAVPPGLGVGMSAPDFSVLGADGETITLDDLRSRGKPVALIFGEPGCGPCSALVPELRRWHQALAGDLTLGLVGIDTYLRYDEVAERDGTSISETYERNPDLAAEADQLHAVFASYRLRATPSAVLVTPEGTIASATVDGRPAIKALIRLAVSGRGAAGLHVHQAPVSGPVRSGTS